MRGFPLMNLLAVVVVLAALLVPLLRVDRPVERSSLADSPVFAQATVPVMLLLRGIHAPSEVNMTVEGESVPLRGTGLERQGTTRLRLLDRALEVSVKATWPPGTPATVLELCAAPDGMADQFRNVWAEAGAADEIVRFSWRAQP